ncbi:MAG: ribonuclease P protein component [Parvularculaceae bacterium]
MKPLKKRADFLRLRRGAKAGTLAFLLVRRFRDDGRAEVRVGLTVTKKLGGAVFRNHIRRRLRAAVREVFPEHAEAGADYVLVARRSAYTRKYAALLDDMKRALLSLRRKTG